jgi:hypothetical protein
MLLHVCGNSDFARKYVLPDGYTIMLLRNGIMQPPRARLLLRLRALYRVGAAASEEASSSRDLYKEN